MSKGFIGLILVVIGIIIWIAGFIMNLDILNLEDTAPCLLIIIIGGLIITLGGFLITKDESD